MEHIEFKITGVQAETPDAKTYFIEPLHNKVTYKAGQFLTLLVNVGKEVRRSYSLTSSPAVDNQMFFTVKRIENGEVSRHLFDKLEQDNIIISLPPTGRFTIEQPSAESVFIAAGSGITPVFSLLKQLLHTTQHTTACLIYQNHNEEHAIFRSQLLALKDQFAGRFTFIELFSKPINNLLMPKRLNNSLLEQLVLAVTKTRKPKFYLCGPPAFMRMAGFTLRVMQYSNHDILQENFFAVAPPPPALTNKGTHKVQIHYLQHNYKLDVTYPNSILEAALKNNIRLPYSCRGGRCSTCIARCVSGKVTMSINDILTTKDLENGLLLTCVAYPESDVEITYH